jgi:hypothetical protein
MKLIALILDAAPSTLTESSIGTTIQTERCCSLALSCAFLVRSKQAQQQSWQQTKAKAGRSENRLRRSLHSNTAKAVTGRETKSRRIRRNQEISLYFVVKCYYTRMCLVFMSCDHGAAKGKIFPRPRLSTIALTTSTPGKRKARMPSHRSVEVSAQHPVIV